MSSTSINRPDPQVLFSPSGKSKLGRKDMLQRYDEWLKIASENVRSCKKFTDLPHSCISFTLFHAFHLTPFQILIFT